ncbi:MAG: hypothetical protein ACRDPS_11970 [Nocardioides sp.]|uniref:hypothetical protein n=1 Tax=Nocardioides sp. TaxID=35761 RepID=UPI003D6A114A
MGGYEVTIEDLRRTAGKYDALREDLGSSKMPDSALGPDRLGHVEVASWMKETMQAARDVHRQLGEGLGSLSEYLRTKARHYEQADLDSADLMKPGPWAESGGHSKLTPLLYSPGQGTGSSQPLPNILGEGGAQFSPLTPPPSTAREAD